MQNLVKNGNNVQTVSLYNTLIETKTESCASKIQFLFLVSLTAEYKVNIAYFFPYTEFCVVTLKNLASRALKLPKSKSAHL